MWLIIFPFLIVNLVVGFSSFSFFWYGGVFLGGAGGSFVVVVV